MNFLLLLFTLLCAYTVHAQEVVLDSPLPLPASVLSLLELPTMKTELREARLRYAAERDAKTLRDWLHSEGYLDATVNIVEPDTRHKNWRWRANSGALWHIATVHISPPPPALQPLPQSGQPFVSSRYDELKQELRYYWHDQGFLNATYRQSTVIPNHADKTVTITWQMELGQLCRIGSIHVSGNEQYGAWLARDLSMLHPGQELRASLLQQANKLMVQEGHYRHAVAIPQLGEQKDDAVPVTIQVREAPRREISAEAGYSRDARATIGANWTDRGLWQGLLEYQLRTSWSQQQGGEGITLARPAWPNSRDRSGITLDLLHEQTAGRHFASTTGGIFWRRQFNNRDHVHTALHQRWVQGAERYLRVLEPSIQLRIDRLHHHGNGLPFQGWRSDFKIMLPFEVGAAERWQQITLDGAAYWQPDRRLLLAFRAGYGHLFSLLSGAPPKLYRLFLGGQGSVRGYAQDSIGPVAADGLAQGGLHRAYVGADLVLLPQRSWSPVVFSDLGKVWNTPVDKERMAISAGLGLMVATPIGHLRIDFATPLRRRSQDPVLQFYLAMGQVL